MTFLTSEPNPDDIALRIAPADASAPAEIVRAAAPFYWDFVDPSRLILHTGSTGSEAFLGEVDLEGDSLENADILSGSIPRPGDRRRRCVAGLRHRRERRSRGRRPAGGRGARWVEPPGDPGRWGRCILVRPDVDHPRLHRAETLATDPPAPIPSGPLRTVDPATGEVRTLLDGSVLAFFWSPDGQTIAALDIRPADSGPGPGEARASGARLASTASGASGAALPPFAAETPGIGLHLSFIDAASAAIRSERDIRVSELFAFQVVPYFDQYARSHRFWAPDNSSIVLPLADEDNLDHVVVIPADGGDPHEVATGWIGFWSP